MLMKAPQYPPVIISDTISPKKKKVSKNSKANDVQPSSANGTTFRRFNLQ